MGNSGHQWATMGNNGQQWVTMDNNGHQWTTIRGATCISDAVFENIKCQDFNIIFPGLAVQCLSVGVEVNHAKELGEEEEMVANISKHGAIKDLNEKIRRPRQAEGGDHSGDPLDWLRASVPGEPGQDYPVLSAIQVDIVIMIFVITNVLKAFTFQGLDVRSAPAYVLLPL